jgi:hypothetical protein
MQFYLPMKGKNTAFAYSSQPQFTSPRMNNFRPREVLGKRMRGGQRPGLTKQYNEYLGGPIVGIVEVTTVSVS